MTADEEREAARNDPRQLDLFEPRYRTKIDWQYSIIMHDHELAKRLFEKPPVVRAFIPDKHPIRF